MIILVTGTPGSGKTLFVVSKILELKKQFPERKIYSDIEGLQIEGVDQSPEDWRTTPNNSIVIYDEAQQHTRFRSGTQSNNDDIVQALQVHRHTGHDIWFITQSPRFLNTFVKDLVGEHYHLHRPYGAALASVYYWRSVRANPQSLSSRELAENEFLFKYPKELFNYYQSATQHNVKLKIPKKLFIIVGAMLAIGGLVYKMVFSEGTQKMVNGQLGASVPVSAPAASTSPVAPAATASTIQNLDQECRKGVNVEKPECVQWFNNLSKSNSSVQDNNAAVIRSVSYDPAKPFDDSSIRSEMTYEVKQKPVFAGCMKKNGRYIAYTQQGTILNEVSQADCKRVVENGDRPFDYFKDSQDRQLANDVEVKKETSSEEKQTSTYVIGKESI